ncbi:MAG TPA: hypothetical protein VGJ05_15355 [Fimbriiglobus sp.]|jgi:hypothetical protein
MMFQRKPSHTYIGDVWRDPDNRHDKREEDHSLYFDSETGQYIVVEEVEQVSGPNVSCSHTIHTVQEYLKLHPDRREVVECAIAAHKK